mmetsp:Transcript_6334/g.10575  ORF Transcript_6334/g.10575 Transcript_6334/m.10575 type:complete len:200 (-) Transcript_6334:404-1003(-)
MGHIAIALAVEVHSVGHVVLTARGALSRARVTRITYFPRVGIVRQHSDVDPGGRVPPGVVVPLFRALQAAPIAIGVLASAPLVVATNELVGGVQALVALRALAQLVRVVALVHPVAASGYRIRDGGGFVVGDGVGSCILVISWNSVTRSCNVRTRAKVLLAKVRCTRFRFILYPRPKIINLRIQCIFTGVLKNDFTRNF